MYLMIGFPCEWLNFVKFAFAYFLLGKLPMQAVGREKKTDNSRNYRTTNPEF